MKLETRIYQKENTLDLFSQFKACFSDIRKSRFLAKQLAVRDIKAMYRQSFLGIAWMFITPLLTSLVWIVLNASGTVQLTDTGIPYPLYAFSGTLIWSIITEAINAPMQVTTSAKGILSKINFPKEGLLISGVYKLLFNSSIKILLLLLFVFVFGVGFHKSIILFPLTILGAILFGTTIGLFVTPIGLLYQDISKIISIALRFLMYATPVVYALPNEGMLRTIMELNPITPLVLTARDTIVGFSPQYLGYYMLIMGLCIPLLFLGLLFYRISIPVIVERLNA